MQNLLTQSSRHTYALYASLVLIVLIITACSSPQPKPDVSDRSKEREVITQQGARTPAKSKTNAIGNKVVSLAQSTLGSPYKYGGSSPRGFDCSGLVYYTHKKLGIAVPRTTRAQAQHAAALKLRDIQPGDILFFKIYGNKISHVGIYTGSNQFIHAPQSGKFVSYASINDPFWRARLVKAGRLH